VSGLLTWKDTSRHGASFAGLADDVRLFAYTYDSHKSYPGRPWVMSTDLPGLSGKRWRAPDEATLRAMAEQVLAGWLARVTRLPTGEAEQAARETDYEAWSEEFGPDSAWLARAAYEAGWLARAARAGGGQP
jgi:hypothetical protein